MNEAHDRFADWLSAGAEGDPPRDLAVHAWVCAGCRQSLEALDQLAAIDPGRAGPPSSSAIREPGWLARTAPQAGLAAAAVFGAIVLGLGASQLIGLARGPVALASPTPNQQVLGGTATPQQSAEGTAPSPDNSGGPDGTESPSARPGSTPRPKPGATPAPYATPVPTPAPTPPPLPGSPGAPKSLAAESGIGQIALSWFAPASTGGSPILHYDIFRDNSSTATYSTTSLSYVDIVGNGVTHSYAVTAVNVVGPGPYSNVVAATTADVPGAPSGLTATGEIGQIVLSWSAPGSGGSPILHYDIVIDGTTTVQVTTPGYTDTGLANGSTHSYVVTAVNAVGSSASASDAATTPDAPGAPSGLSATTTIPGEIDLDWTAPANNGSSITGYDIYRDGSLYITTSATNYQDAGLGSAESHAYYVIAHTGVGDGPPSTTETGTGP